MNSAILLVRAWLAINPCSPAQAAPSAHEIMVKNEDARKIDTVNSNATLETGGGGSADRKKSFIWWRKLTTDKVHFDTLTRFLAPADIRGEAILFVEHGDENEVQMYLPAFKKIRRVEGQDQSGSFMGSEFSYSDIATPHVEDYTYKLLREETCPSPPHSSEAATLKCFVIQSTPVTDGTRDRTGYSKTISWIRPDIFMSVHAEYYGLDGSLEKKMNAAETKEVDTARHKWMAHDVRIENSKTQRYTVLHFKDVKVNGDIPDATFTQQNLSRER